MPKRVAFYVRVSTDGQTVENQLGELHAVASRHEWEVIQIYADRGISGTKGREGRPEFDKLLKAIARKEVDMVAAWSVDRLGRSLKDLVSLLIAVPLADQAVRFAREVSHHLPNSIRHLAGLIRFASVRQL
jgi:DNA invertase Pin-like site-specific DNA recombinase